MKEFAMDTFELFDLGDAMVETKKQGGAGDNLVTKPA
jgi:hypothetical protein